MIRAHPLVATISGAALVAAALGMFILLAPGRADLPSSPHAASEAPEVQPAPAEPMPAEAPPMQGNESIEQLIAGVINARQRDDRVWLARTLYSVPMGAEPEDVHLLRAYRYFLSGSAGPLWQRVEDAWLRQAYSIQHEGEIASVEFETGGSLGSLTLRFIQAGQGWYFMDM
jgi:hypothetical protein